MTARTQAVLDQVNATTGSDWALGEPMAGGWQAGAWRLHDGEAEAVLKWWDRTDWAPRVLGAASLVDAARRQGYPTPAWLAHGTTTEGYPFQVQEFVTGKPVKALTTAAAQLLIDLIDQQRGITLRTKVNWTSIMRAAAIDHEGSHQQRLQGHGVLLDVLIAARELAAPHAHCEPPDTEMVHGDLSMSNVLVRDGVVTGAVDIEAIGRGCAVFDLLTPVRQGHMYGAEERPRTSRDHCPQRLWLRTGRARDSRSRHRHPQLRALPAARPRRRCRHSLPEVGT